MIRLYPINLFLRRLPIAIFLGIGLLMNLATWLWLSFTIIPMGEENVFLHYTILFGVDLIGPGKRILALPSLGLSILLLNAFIGWLTFPRERLVSYILAVGACFCQIFLFIAGGLLIFLNA